LVRERATQLEWLICIASDGHKSPRLIRQLYADHFELNDKFLNWDISPAASLPSQPYPSGICIWKGRVVCWYRPSVFGDYCQGIGSDLSTLREARFRHFCLPPRDPLLQCPEGAKTSDRSAAILRQQLDLEKQGMSSPRKRTIPFNVWATIADWVVEVAECFNLEDITIFQAMALLDRFLHLTLVGRMYRTISLLWAHLFARHASIVHTLIPPQILVFLQQEVSPSHYQLVAGSSLLLASKCNKAFLTCKDICYCADNSFSPDQVEATEELILEQLEWKLAFPTSMDFLLSFARILNMDENGRPFVMYSYINELSLQSGAYFCYPPSVVGASSMLLGRYCLQDFSPRSCLWPKELVDASGLMLNEILACTVQLSRDLANSRMTMPDLTMVRRRHSKSSRHCVAEVDIPALPSSRFVAAFEERLRSHF
jgi:hypothetical protein